METFTIGQLAKRANVNVETIRYYQRRQLLAVPVRLTGYRKYTEEYVQRISVIQQMQQLGFSLREISDLINLDGNTSCDAIQEVGLQKISQIEQKIESLQQIKDFLQMLLIQCDKRFMKDCLAVEHLGKKQK
ncbi:MerR family transcriptional regulator [Candidatus Uabimicrobium sp. HlEnr_7]|uniref:MerR family transcriptional regulator n=1 Tax=Candidatus Uabimicrobium helgolandensis TaxID=3095367 RepID=UPI0035567880